MPEGIDACFVPLTGDARSPYCTDAGFNLELDIVRREGVPLPGRTAFIPLCELSEDERTDCPDPP